MDRFIKAINYSALGRAITWTHLTHMARVRQHPLCRTSSSFKKRFQNRKFITLSPFENKTKILSYLAEYDEWTWLVGWVFRELQEIDISSTRLFDFLKCFDRNQFPLKLHYLSSQSDRHHRRRLRSMCQPRIIVRLLEYLRLSPPGTMSKWMRMESQ